LRQWGKFFGPGEFEHRTSKNLHRTNMLPAITLQPSAWGPTPGPLEDIHVSDVTMKNVACALHVSIREGNTADRLTFERLKAAGVYSSAVSLESWAEQPIGEVTLRDVQLEYTPDAVIDPRLGKPPSLQDPIRQPGVGVWNRKLPVWGVYGRYIRTMHISDLTLRTSDAQDARPVIPTDDVRELRVENLHHSQLPPGTHVIQQRSR
jgi:hypothetical protein